jgi:O-antigen/teichoic acid export membrane protein
MWVLPYAAGIVLFAPDLVTFLLGRSWHGAIVLLQGLAIVGAITQLGFNWFSFYRGHGDPRPQAVEAAAGTAAFLVLAIGGLLLGGFHGFVGGRIAAALVMLAVRRVYIGRLLAVGYRELLAPTLLPVTLAGGAALAVRFALWGGRRSLLQAVLELVLFLAVYGATAIRRERNLLNELFGAIRRQPAMPASEELAIEGKP